MHSLVQGAGGSNLPPVSFWGEYEAGRLIMGMLYVAAGVAHFLLTHTYEQIVPDYLPAHRELVLISGMAEIAGGLGVLVPQTQRPAAWGIIALLVAVFPANITMLQQHQRFPSISVWMLWARLPLQGVLIWWAWQYTRSAEGSNLPNSPAVQTLSKAKNRSEE